MKGKAKKPPGTGRFLKQHYKRQAAGQSLKQALLYLLFGILWILFSDTLMAKIATGESNMMLISNIKGIIYVFLTAAVFFILMYGAVKKILKSNETVVDMAYTDGLTGLRNRKYIETILPEIDKDENLPLSVIIGDFNGLKLVNEAFGHSLGNELLQLSAAAMTRVCRAQDIVSKWGSDEFLILLPCTGENEARDMVGRLKAECAQQSSGAIHVDITFGWCTKLKTTDNLADVIGEAENVMFDYKTVDSKSMHNKTISVIMSTLHEKSPREAAHSKRVGELCRQLSKSAGFPAIETDRMTTIGFLHDIGKIAVHDAILNKSDTLTEDELLLIRQHTEIGYRILLSYYGITDITEAVLSHHERWDGSGYPKGLHGEEIPRIARIVAIADSFDAMTSDRPYRKKMPPEAAAAEIQKNAGLQFDPELARIFIEKVVGISPEHESITEKTDA
jgi:diguanylate cyclase (GGDEF)-like protein